MSNIRVLHITNAYPNTTMPEYGIFIKEQIESLTNIDSEILFVNAAEKGSLEYVRAIFKLKRIHHDYDVIHCHHFYSFLVYYFALGGKANTVVSFLNDWDKEIELGIALKWKCKLLNYFVAKMPFVIFKSFPPYHLKSRTGVYFLPNGVDSNVFKVIKRTDCIKKLGLINDKKYVLFVSSKWMGRRQKRKDRFDAVIDKVKKVDDSVEPLYLSGVPRENIPYFYGAASLHLLTSDYEGSPNSVKESLSCGTPVISTKVGSVEALLNNVSYCTLFEEWDLDLVADAVIKVLNIPADRNLIRREFLSKGITKQEVALKLEKIYEAICR